MKTANEVTYGASKVILNPRSDGRYTLRWRENEAWKRTTAKDKTAALEKARKIAKRLDSNMGIKRVSMEESRAVELLKENLGKRTLLDVATGVKQLLQVLPNNVSVNDIAREWENRSQIKQVEMKALVDQIEKLYDEESGKSKESYKSIGAELNLFLRTHPGLFVQDLDKEFLNLWLNRKLNNGEKSSAQYFNNRLAIWKNVLNRAREWEMLPEKEKTAAEKISKKSLPRRIPPIFSVKEAQSSLDFLQEQEEVDLVIGYAIAAFSGMRPSEIQRLEWANIDLESRYIHADEHVCRKLQQERFIPIHDNLKNILSSVTQWSGLICPNSRWRQISLELRENEIINKWPEDVRKRPVATRLKTLAKWHPSC